MEIDWGKNHSFTDHSPLFLSGDVQQIPYVYAEGEAEMKEGLARKLGSVQRRLDLLGYSPLELPKRYAELVEGMPDYYEDAPMTFEQFSSVIVALDLSKAFQTPDEGDHSFGQFVSRYVFQDPEIKKLLPVDLVVDKDVGIFFENLDPYITLRLLAMNSANSDRLVQWRYADEQEDGLVKRNEVVKPLSEESKILVVTEGSSDSYVIERVLNELYPEVADFFRFVDMEKHYPFTGTGNLYNFCAGLAKIRIQNKILVLFDSDAAGIEKFKKALALDRPRTMVICRLPDHPDFKFVKTAGPQGITEVDINGSAVAIECFLDLQSIASRPAMIRWTSFNRELGRYQGEIEDKEELVKRFKKADLKAGIYDTTRLRFLIDHLLAEWICNSSEP